MNMSHPIENIMRSTMEELKNMIDVNTVVGEAVFASGEATVLPVSKVSFGFISGGGEYGRESKVKSSGEQLDAQEGRYPFAGTSVAGVSLTPMAFLAADKSGVKLLPTQYPTSIDRVIDHVPQLLLAVERVLCGGKKTCEDGQEQGGEKESRE